jgi:hypothetical protein
VSTNGVKPLDPVEKLAFPRLIKNAQMQVEPCEIPFAGAPEILVGNGFKPFPTMYAATSLSRA